MDQKDQDKGEGSYSGTRDYNERTKKFIDSGKVEQAGRLCAHNASTPSSKRTHVRKP
jgi:hypothetical protein